jgi:hypothetical protein
MGSAATAFRLDSAFTPGSGGAGAIALPLYNLGDRPIANFRLALTSLFRVKTGGEITGGKILEQISNYHVISPPESFRLEPGAAWSISADQLSHPLTHYNFGPSVRAGTQPLHRRTDRGGRRWRGRCCGPMCGSREAAPAPYLQLAPQHSVEVDELLCLSIVPGRAYLFDADGKVRYS